MSKVTKDELHVFDQYLAAVVAALLSKGSHSNQDAPIVGAKIAKSMLEQRRNIIDQLEKEGI